MKGQRTFRRITLSELGAWQSQRPDALVLDARDADSHARNGWIGSVFLGRHNQDELLLRTSRRQPVLIYCQHGNASQDWAQMFADFGFTDVCDLIGGHAAWMAREGFTGAHGRSAHDSATPVGAANLDGLKLLRQN
jgi:rhodanese-related sulfurtransferase